MMHVNDAVDASVKLMSVPRKIIKLITLTILVNFKLQPMNVKILFANLDIN